MTPQDHTILSQAPHYDRCHNAEGPLGRYACQGLYSNTEGIGKGWLAALRAQERAVLDAIQPHCTDLHGDCVGITAAMQALMSLAMETSSARSVNGSIGLAGGTFDGHRHRQCNLVVLGDSHSLQLYDAAVCGLAASRAAVRLRSRVWKDPRLESWESLSRELKLRAAADGNEQFRRQWAGMPVLEQVFGLLPHADSEMRTQMPADAVLATVTYVQRNGMQDGPADVLLAGHLQSAMGALGRCTILLYNEGAHSGAAPEAAFRMAIRAAISSLRAISEPRGPIAMAWEVAAQHFHTFDGSGMYERRIGAQQHEAKAPPPANATAAWYVHSRTVRLGHESMRSASQVRWGECANDTLRGVTDWRNSILSEEVARAPPLVAFGSRGGHHHRGSHILLSVPLLPFWNVSQAWGATLHTFKADCSHVCYTPYYHLPVWHSLRDVLRARARYFTS